MNARTAGYTQATSSAKAGFSERTGRELDKRRQRLQRGEHRAWRTRPDPFETVWEKQLAPMLSNSPGLSALTLLEYLQATHGPEVYPDNTLRTLQRRVKQWRQTKGPSQEVMFRQEYGPGELGLSDFTQLKDIVVTVQGEPFPHLLYHFRLRCSGWSHMEVVLGGESYAALSEGLQNALWHLGGAPREHRTDSLSAGFRNFFEDAIADQTRAYEALCAHYGMTPSRNNRGVAHENGAIESPHGHVKWRIRQAFLIRGNSNFASLDAYRHWISEVVSSHNRRNARAVAMEKSALQPLPTQRTADYTVLPARVSTSSTIQVRTSLYTVPSRLIGACLQVRLYDDRLECYLGREKVMTLGRVYGNRKLRRARCVDYRHVIDSLVKKPMAFYRSKLRDALLPGPIWREIWERLCEQAHARDASKLMVSLLDLAAKTDREHAIAQKCCAMLKAKEPINILALRREFHYPAPPPTPEIDVSQHAILMYNMFIPALPEVHHAVH